MYMCPNVRVMAEFVCKTLFTSSVRTYRRQLTCSEYMLTAHTATAVTLPSSFPLTLSCPHHAALVTALFLLLFLHFVTAVVTVLFLLPFLHFVTAVVTALFLLLFLHFFTAVVTALFLLPFLHFVTAVVTALFLLPFLHFVTAVVVSGFIFLFKCVCVASFINSFLYCFCFSLTPLFSLYILTSYLCVCLVYVHMRKNVIKKIKHRFFGTRQDRARGTLYQTAAASDFELLVEKVECC